MKMRKLIAVLVAVLMLCSIIPMGAMVSAANKLDNNFDDGTVGKFKCDSVDTIVNEDGVMKWTTQGWKNLYASFSVTGNADYKVTFKMKAAAATAMEVKYLNGSWGDSGIAKDTINIGTEWTEYSRILNAGSNNALVLLFQSHKATDVYIDDVKVADYVAPVDPEIPDDAIYFENFETDHTWASGNANAPFEVIPAGDAPATKAENGNYVVKHTIPSGVYPYISDRNGISVQPNTDYIVSFDALNKDANWPVQVIIAENYWLGGSFALSLSQQIKPSNTAWETYSFVFNTGDHDKIWLGAKSQWANTTVYFDNFYIAPLNGSVQNDGYLKNGNFEAGALEWLHTSNTEITADDTGAGQGNVITTNELGSGVHMFSQPATNLVVDHEYVLSFKVYGRAASGANSAFWVQFPSAFTTWSVDTTLGTAKHNNYTPRINVTTNVGAWHTVNITFTAKADVAVINFLNYRANQGFYSFDDISITPKHIWNAATCAAPKTCSICGATDGEALPHTYAHAYDSDCDVCASITNIGNRDVELPIADVVQNSVSEGVKGLAFKFDMNDIEISLKADSDYEADYDNAKIGNNIKLVMMGAVVANTEGADLTLEAARNSNGNIINVEAKNLFSVDATTASFAVRVKNIPANHLDTTIYARPYFVIEIGDVQYTVYGDMQYTSYNAVANQ